jgi:hypothetical protein
VVFIFCITEVWTQGFVLATLPLEPPKVFHFYYILDIMCRRSGDSLLASFSLLKWNSWDNQFKKRKGLLWFTVSVHSLLTWLLWGLCQVSMLWQRKLLTSWHPGSTERGKEGRVPSDTIKGPTSSP